MMSPLLYCVFLAHSGSREVLFSPVGTLGCRSLLKTDSDFVKKVILARKKLPPMHVGRYSQLQEWLQDLDDPKDQHRHVSHLFGLYPSRQISPYSTPELFEAARNSLIFRGDGGTVKPKAMGIQCV